MEAAAAGVDVSMAKASRRELAERFRNLFAEFRQGFFGRPSPGNESGKTTRRGITRELLDLRRHREMLLDNVSDGIMEVAHPSGKVLYANRQAAVLLDQPEEMLLGRQLANLFPEGLQGVVQQVIASALPQRRMNGGEKVVPFKGRLLALSALLPGGVAGDTLLFFLRDVTAVTQGEEAAQSVTLLLDQIFNSSSDGKLVLDLNGHIVRMNSAYQKMFHVEEQEEGLLQCCNLSPGPRCHTADCSLHRILQGEERVEFEEEKRSAGGEVVPVQIVAVPLRDHEGRLIGVVENFRDISERRRNDQAMRQSSERFRAIFDNTLVGILFATADRVIADVNDRAASVLGYTREELLGESLAMLHLSPAHFERFGSEILSRMDGKGLIQMEYQLRRKDGTPVWASLSGKVVTLSDLGPGMLWVADDLSRRKQIEEDQRQIIEELRQMQEALRTQSIRDPLTGLYNRRYMEESLQREISKARRQAASLVLFMLDLDHFKQVNDTYGHVTGDWVLRKLGEIIRHSIREEDIACRYGGEEFVVIFPNIPAEDARRRAEDLRATVEQHLVIEQMGQHLGGVTISIGIAMHQPGMDRETLLREADHALYRAKKEGRNRVVL
ncbi:MAG: diguanylate cyclase [Thermodesulfobacteriota bacterium]